MCSTFSSRMNNHDFGVALISVKDIVGDDEHRALFTVASCDWDPPPPNLTP